MEKLEIKSSLRFIIDLDKEPHNEDSLQLIYDKLNMIAAYVKSQLYELKKPIYMGNFVLAAFTDIVDEEVINSIQRNQDQPVTTSEKHNCICYVKEYFG